MFITFFNNEFMLNTQMLFLLQIVEELVYIVHYLPSEINCVFYKEHEEDRSVKANGSPQQTLGSADLHLNYARIVIAIQVLVRFFDSH